MKMTPVSGSQPFVLAENLKLKAVAESTPDKAPSTSSGITTPSTAYNQSKTHDLTLMSLVANEANLGRERFGDQRAIKLTSDASNSLVGGARDLMREDPINANIGRDPALRAGTQRALSELNSAESNLLDAMATHLLHRSSLSESAMKTKVPQEMKAWKSASNTAIALGQTTRSFTSIFNEAKQVNSVFSFPGASSSNR